jgi:hypothetical protein
VLFRSDSRNELGLASEAISNKSLSMVLGPVGMKSRIQIWVFESPARVCGKQLTELRTD